MKTDFSNLLFYLVIKKTIASKNMMISTTTTITIVISSTINFVWQLPKISGVWVSII